MLSITFLNDKTGTEDVANYEVTVWVNRDVVARGRVEGHQRAEGWQALVARYLSEAKAQEQG